MMNKEVYKANGTNTSYGVNMSGIITKLIKLAAKCEAFSSDIMYDLAELVSAEKEGNYVSGDYWFGFRDMGVDHEAFIRCRLGDHCYGDHPYWAIWKLNIDVVDDDVRAVLYEVTYDEAREQLGITA